ncbi:MAG: tellurite methyltransferase [Gammaproteobacteria bacterium]|jgi:tellurite methyltransferase
MSITDKERWDARYAGGSYADRVHPSPLLGEWLERISGEYPGGRALDVACGRGRNAICLAQAGFRTTAVDISEVAIELATERARTEDVEVNWQCADLDNASIEVGGYDIVVVSRYLHRGRIPDLIDSLRPGGTVLYEQHAELDPPPPADITITGPRNRIFRLRSNELLGLFHGLQVRYYEEGVFTDPDGVAAALGRLVARKT